MMETVTLKRDCQAIAVPSGTQQTLRAGSAVRILLSRGGSYSISGPDHAMYRIDAADADALGLAPAPTQDTAQQGSLSEDLVWKALKTVYDPELPVNIVDLGLVFSCAITPAATGGKSVAVRMGVTNPGCGMSNVIKSDVEALVRKLPEVTQADVQVVFDPPWSPDRMSESAKLALGFDLDSGRSSGLTQIR